jgi:hypothetical protein
MSADASAAGAASPGSSSERRSRSLVRASESTNVMVAKVTATVASNTVTRAYARSNFSEHEAAGPRQGSRVTSPWHARVPYAS